MHGKVQMHLGELQIKQLDGSIFYENPITIANK